MWFIFVSDTVHLRTTWKCEKIAKQKRQWRHFDICRSSLKLIKKVEKRQQKLVRENLCINKRNHEVRLPAWCGEIFSLKAVRFFYLSSKFTSNKKKSCSPLVRLMQCGFQSKSSTVFFLVFKNLHSTKNKPCSSLSRLMQCVLSSDAVRCSVEWSTHVDLGVAKNRMSHFGKFEIPLKP